MPIASTKRNVRLYNYGSKVPQSDSNKLILNAAFETLVIYKDKDGKKDQRIITYIPDLAYLKKHNNIKHNRIGKLDKDFSGYLEYKD